MKPFRDVVSGRVMNLEGDFAWSKTLRRFTYSSPVGARNGPKKRTLIGKMLRLLDGAMQKFGEGE